uniref:C3H1-type domain-containing protein n=2 Tax=Davidia involucrata TaxID=16924 RepID=A0A5B7B3P1_DAVIN
MQDCSYFLQGLCSNESCPYRHVNVSPNASICEGFLRGYCADGNECQKKHSYVCPIFEATGICPKGSKCKLHHPKKRTKGNKRKPSREQKNTQGRYFDSRHIDIAECRAAVYEKHSSKDDDDIFFLGRFTDYISVDVSDEEAGETKDPTRGQTTLCDGDPRDVQVEDIDELIKPIHIMNKNLMTESSAAIDSTSERTASYVSEESNLL